MSQSFESPPDDEIDLRDYLLVLWQKCYILTVVFLAVVAIVWFTTPSSGNPLFATRTRLLLVRPVSESINSRPAGGAGAFSSRSLSSETLTSLSTANDLLVKIISRLNLTDEISGEHWPAERLAGMITTTVESSNGDAGSPLITMTVRGEAPALIKNISDVWADVFVEQNSILFATAARSYDFVLAQYQELESTVETIELERKAYQNQNSLPVLVDELKLKQEDLRNYLNTFLDTSANLGVKMRQYESTLDRLNELSVEGKWIGLQINGEFSGDLRFDSLEQKAVLRAKEDYFNVQEKLQVFHAESGLTLMKQDLARISQMVENGDWL